MAQVAEGFLKTGTVKFYNHQQRYGFIDGDDGVARFFNSNELRCATIVTGAAVKFIPARNASGAYARQVQLA